MARVRLPFRAERRKASAWNPRGSHRSAVRTRQVTTAVGSVSAELHGRRRWSSTGASFWRDVQEDRSPSERSSADARSPPAGSRERSLDSQRPCGGKIGLASITFPPGHLFSHLVTCAAQAGLECVCPFLDTDVGALIVSRMLPDGGDRNSAWVRRLSARRRALKGLAQGREERGDFGSARVSSDLP